MNSRRFGYVAAWLVAALVAVAVGIAAVSTVGASIRDRGPLGIEVARDVDRREPVPTPDPGVAMRRDTVTGEFGEFVAGCRGVVAYGLSARAVSPWQVVSYDQGPDDDVDAVFSRRGRSIEVEVFCNQGKPTVAEIERNTLPEDD